MTLTELKSKIDYLYDAKSKMTKTNTEQIEFVKGVHKFTFWLSQTKYVFLYENTQKHCGYGGLLDTPGEIFTEVDKHIERSNKQISLF